MDRSFFRLIRFHALERVSGTDHPPFVARTDPTQEQPLGAAPAPSTSPARPNQRNWLAIGLALLTIYVIWGSTYLAIRETLLGFPPFLGAGLRFLIAGSILYVFLRLRGAPHPNHRQWTAAALVGGFLLVGGNGGVVFAEQSVASGVAALMLATVPLWAVLFARVWGRWPTGNEWGGLLIGFVGIIFLNLGGNLSATSSGAIIVVLAAMSWALGSAWSQHLPLPAGAMASAAEMLVGGGILLVLGLLFHERFSAVPPTVSFWALVYLVAFGSTLAFSAYGYLLKRVRPALATSYAYVNPLVALLLGAAFANEQITSMECLALLFILTGVVLVALGRGRSRT